MLVYTSAYWQAANAADDDDEVTLCCLAEDIEFGEAGYGNTWCGGGGGDDGQCCLALSRRLAMLLFPVGHCAAAVESPATRAPAPYK